MHSAATNSRAKGRPNISDARPKCGSTKLAAGAPHIRAFCECVGVCAIRAALTLAVLSALLLIAARPAQAQEKVLYNFTGGSDGSDPNSPLTFDAAGNLYGTTYSGGLGYGTVFELSPNGNGGWNETVLYSFTGAADGANPYYSYVMFDSVGNLYGTAYNGGANGYGVVFELSPVGGSWTETVLYSFAGGADGANPVNGVVMDGAGNLYGKTYSGGWANRGIVFELSPSGGSWTNQVICGNCGAGGSSYSGLTMDYAGNIYTTSYGQVIVLKPNGNGGWTAYVIHSFNPHSTKDGYGAQGTVVIDPLWGDLYGTTVYGGAKNAGTLYRLKHGTKGWTENILHSFMGGKLDGAMPWGELAFDPNGYIYGTTAGGGESGKGTVFVLFSEDFYATWYYEPLLWNFNGPDGDGPSGSLIEGSRGNLYGTTAGGGSNGAGVVFQANGWASPVRVNLTSLPNPSTYGQAVTFTAVIPSLPPDGETVTFENGTTVLGTGALSGGSASLTTSTLGAGTRVVTAVYGGDWNFLHSTSKPVKQVVSKATTTTALASSQNPSNYKQSVTFTASVTPQFSGTVTGPVTFYDGTTALKTVPLGAREAKFITSTLASGTHSITATYNGSASFDGSTSAPVNQVVLVVTTTTLSSSPNPSAYGQAVAFTATVASTLGAPPPDGETVSFMKGTTLLGTGTLSGGMAGFTTSTLPVGTNAITAVYGGDSNLPGSTSKAVNQVVGKATTTTTLASSPNPSNSGQSVTFTASVAPEVSGTVTGIVTFYDGTTALGKESVKGGEAKFITSTLASGTHTITATYNGSTSFTGSSASLTQTVN